MPITITHLEGPLEGQTQTFNDTIKEIKFGRSRENDVVPSAPATLGREDILRARRSLCDYPQKVGSFGANIQGCRLRTSDRSTPTAAACCFGSSH
jgi:hypothetical protein